MCAFLFAEPHSLERLEGEAGGGEGGRGREREREGADKGGGSSIFMLKKSVAGLVLRTFQSRTD